MKTKDSKTKRSQGELAVLLGISRQTLSYHVRGGHAPPITDVAGWQTFLAAVGKGGSGGTADVRNQIALERLQLVRAANAKAERENKIADGTLISLETARRSATAAAGYFWLELARLEREAPRTMSGLPPNELRDKLGAFLKDLRERSRVHFAAIGAPPK